MYNTSQNLSYVRIELITSITGTQQLKNYLFIIITHNVTFRDYIEGGGRGLKMVRGSLCMNAYMDYINLYIMHAYITPGSGR